MSRHLRHLTERLLRLHRRHESADPTPGLIRTALLAAVPEAKGRWEVVCAATCPLHRESEIKSARAQAQNGLFPRHHEFVPTDDTWLLYVARRINPGAPTLRVWIEIVSPFEPFQDSEVVATWTDSGTQMDSGARGRWEVVVS